MRSNFELVSEMNEAFNNAKGDPNNIDWKRIRKQSHSIFHEALEVMAGLGANSVVLEYVRNSIDLLQNDDVFTEPVELDAVRDGLCDVHVFAYGAHHLMGIDADRDMLEVVSAVQSRFIKSPEDLEETLRRYAAKGVKEVYTQGTFPTMVLKSAADQHDAPKDKFLKASSYREPSFYNVKKESPMDK